LDAHLKEHLHLTVESVTSWVKKRWKVRYTQNGMAALLRRLVYVYKKPKLVPG
jgi:transposase